MESYKVDGWRTPQYAPLPDTTKLSVRCGQSVVDNPLEGWPKVRRRLTAWLLPKRVVRARAGSRNGMTQTPIDVFGGPVMR